MQGVLCYVTESSDKNRRQYCICRPTTAKLLASRTDKPTQQSATFPSESKLAGYLNRLQQRTFGHKWNQLFYGLSTIHLSSTSGVAARKAHSLGGASRNSVQVPPRIAE